MATPAELARNRYAREIERALRARGRLNADGAREVFDIMGDLRASILDRLATLPEGSATLTNVSALEAALEDTFQEFVDRYGDMIDAQMLQSWAAGKQAVTGPLEAAFEGSLPAPVIGTDLLEVMRATTAQLVQDVSDVIKTEISAKVRLGAAGVLRPFEVEQEIVKVLRTTRKKGERQNLAARAERIVRTELNRTWQVANNEAIKEIRDTVPGVKKQWITTQDGRQRPGHQLLHEQILPMNQLFKYTDPITKRAIRLRYPLDPLGLPESTILCRCQLVIFKDDWEDSGIESGALEQ